VKEWKRGRREEKENAGVFASWRSKNKNRKPCTFALRLHKRDFLGTNTLGSAASPRTSNVHNKLIPIGTATQRLISIFLAKRVRVAYAI